MMRKKICFVVAIPGTASSFLRDHIDNLSRDYDVYLAGNIKSRNEISELNVKDWQHIDISRQISLRNDMKAVLQLRSYFSKMKFDAVHSVTPKAGLATALAGFLSRTPNRIHIFTGQVWATKRGFSRWLLKSIDRMIAKLNTHILVDGPSQRQFLIDNDVIKESRSRVLGEGSICGVNTERFCPDERIRAEVRGRLGISDGLTVFVFMGRLNRDKGLHELLPAFDRLAGERGDVFLLLFGNDEENVSATFAGYKNLSGVNFMYYGATPEPGKMLQAGDVFVLPTYREGFGSSVIEAQCLGLPVITSDAYGVVDASVEGETGLRCHVGDVESLYESMKRLADDGELRKRFGEKGRKRVLDLFCGEVVCRHWLEFYEEIMG